MRSRTPHVCERAPLVPTKRHEDIRSFLLEGCAFDHLLEEAGARARVVQGVERGLVKLFVTDLTYQDLRAIKDVDRRNRLLGIVEEIAPEMAGLPAVLVNPHAKRARPSHLGTIYPVGEDAAELLRRLGVSQRADARQAMAAHWAGATLVTNDEALVRRSQAEGISAMTAPDFVATVIRLLAAVAPSGEQASERDA